MRVETDERWQGYRVFERGALGINEAAPACAIDTVSEAPTRQTSLPQNAVSEYHELTNRTPGGHRHLRRSFLTRCRKL